MAEVTGHSSRCVRIAMAAWVRRTSCQQDAGSVIDIVEMNSDKMTAFLAHKAVWSVMRLSVVLWRVIVAAAAFIVAEEAVVPSRSCLKRAVGSVRTVAVAIDPAARLCIKIIRGARVIQCLHRIIGRPALSAENLDPATA